MVSAPITAIGGTFLAYSEDKSLTVILACVLPLIGLLIGFFAVKGIPLFKKVQIKIDKVNLVLRENLTGIRVIRAFNRIDREEARFDEASRDLTDNYIKVNHIMEATPTRHITILVTRITCLLVASGLSTAL